MDFQLTKTFPSRLENKGKVKKKILKAIDIATKNKVKIICFPELSFDQEFVREVKKYKNIVIIGGSYYDSNRYNMCPVFINGQEYLLRKIHPSPNFETEIIAGKKMKCGDEIIVFTTKNKKLRFGVLICMDYIHEGRELCGEKINFIFNPSYNSDPRRFQKDADVNCENFHVDTFMANVIKRDTKFGGTCVIGLEHKDNLNRLKEEGIKPDDGIDYKLCEINDESMIFVEIRLNKISVPTAADATPRFKLISTYNYSNGKWKNCPYKIHQ